MVNSSSGSSNKGNMCMNICFFFFLFQYFSLYLEVDRAWTAQSL